MNTEEFIKRAKKVHGDKYDYSKVKYTGTFNKVCIICPEHGEFWQTPNGHLSGSECIKCSYKKRGEKKNDGVNGFIEKARKIHGDKYDYSKVEYIDSRTKVCIICPEHSEFWMSPSKHLQGQNCPKCSKNCKSNTIEFIEKARKVHGDKYDYSKVEYINNNTKVCIICPEHGEFWQTPHDHLSCQGCPKCGKKRMADLQRFTKDVFIEKARKTHGDKYDYSKVEYIDSQTPVCIICPEHGEFWQRPNGHIQGQKCPKCSKVYKPTTEEWIDKSNRRHKGKYDYSKVEYVNAKTKVCIICPEHGEFWQLPYAHLQGQGCPGCDMSHLENDINSILKKNNIKFINECSIDGILGRMRVDFYLPDLKIAIECQGGQHFYPAFDRRNKTRAEDIHRKTLIRDIKKRKILDKNNIKTIYYCLKEDYNDDYLVNEKFNGLYTKDNLFYSESDITLSISPSGVQWN